MGIRGRFKGWKSKETVANMTPEDQQKYYDFLKKVENAKKYGKELPEPPEYSGPIETASSLKAKENKEKNGETKRRGRPRKESIVEMDEEGNILSNETDEGKKWWEEYETKSDVQETVIHHCSHEGFCIVETNELYWINKLQKLNEKFPDQVLYDEKWNKKHDTIRAKLPYACMKKVNIRAISDEQKERMSKMGKEYGAKFNAKARNKKDEKEIENEQSEMDEQDEQYEIEGFNDEFHDETTPDQSSNETGVLDTESRPDSSCNETDQLEDREEGEDDVQDSSDEETITEETTELTVDENDEVNKEVSEDEETDEEETDEEETDEEETDEEFEGRPMNMYRAYEEDERERREDEDEVYDQEEAENKEDVKEEEKEN